MVVTDNQDSGPTAPHHQPPQNGARPIEVQAQQDLKQLRKEAGGNVRKWMETVFSEVRDSMPPKVRESYAKYLAKIDEIEAKTGKTLDDANPEGLKLWKAAMQTFRKDAGVTPDTLKNGYIKVYKDWIDGMKANLTSAYERVYRIVGAKEPVDFAAEHQAFLKAQRAPAAKK